MVCVQPVCLVTHIPHDEGGGGRGEAVLDVGTPPLCICCRSSPCPNPLFSTAASPIFSSLGPSSPQCNSSSPHCNSLANNPEINCESQCKISDNCNPDNKNSSECETSQCEVTRTIIGNATIVQNSVEVSKLVVSETKTCVAVTTSSSVSESQSLQANHVSKTENSSNSIVGCGIPADTISDLVKDRFKKFDENDVENSIPVSDPAKGEANAPEAEDNVATNLNSEEPVDSLAKPGGKATEDGENVSLTLSTEDDSKPKDMYSKLEQLRQEKRGVEGQHSLNNLLVSDSGSEQVSLGQPDPSLSSQESGKPETSSQVSWRLFLLILET